jgi:hypothetical protein
MKKTHFPITKTSGIAARHWSKRLHHHQGKKSGEDIQKWSDKVRPMGKGGVMIKKVSNVARGRKG